jgi:hypothetical protein
MEEEQRQKMKGLKEIYQIFEHAFLPLKSTKIEALSKIPTSFLEFW